MDNYYIPIDADKYLRDGEIELVGSPVSWQELFDNTIEKPPKGNFSISRQDQLADFVRVVGGSHGTLAEYLIRRRDGRNVIITTNRELAAATGASLATTNSLLQRLQSADCIRCRTGALMVNPGVSHRGNRAREAFLLELYKNFENKIHI